MREPAVTDKVGKKFDVWARNGRAEEMEAEHGRNVLRFLRSVRFDRPFAFLDVGCGNGWVVREVARNKNCRRAVGIDKSKNMITEARKRPRNGREEFAHTDVESMGRRRFDFIFSIESLYYADSIPAALGKIYRMLRPGGQFFCGTDFYADNLATAGWADMMKIQMHLHSKKEWRRLFRDAGFDVRTRHVRDPKSRKRWKREFGTLFITGTKPRGQYSNSGKRG